MIERLGFFCDQFVCRCDAVVAMQGLHEVLFPGSSCVFDNEKEFRYSVGNVNRLPEASGR